MKESCCVQCKMSSSLLEYFILGSGRREQRERGRTRKSGFKKSISRIACLSNSSSAGILSADVSSCFSSY